MQKNKIKPLKDLRLLDRFLFAELIEFLNYVEKTNELQGETFHSEKVTKIQKAVQQIKSNEQIGVKYMQEWEERQDEIDKAIEADREKRTLELIQKKQAKGKDLTQIADELEMTEEEVQKILDKYASWTSMPKQLKPKSEKESIKHHFL